MLLTSEEMERRRPVWKAMSEFFLDNHLHDSDKQHIAEVLLKSGYSIDELQKILWGDISPVLWPNLILVAGEWTPWDMDFVEHQILSSPAGPVRRWCSYLAGGHVATSDWRDVVAIMSSSMKSDAL